MVNIPNNNSVFTQNSWALLSQYIRPVFAALVIASSLLACGNNKPADAVGSEAPVPGSKESLAAVAMNAENVSGISRLRKSENAIEGRYLITLDELNSEESIEVAAVRLTKRYGGTPDLYFRRVMVGFAAWMTEEQAERMAADSEVVQVEQDRLVVAASIGEPIELTAAPEVAWSSDRSNQATRPLDGSAQSEYQAYGVNVYVMSSGIDPKHPELKGRIGRGFSAGSGSVWLGRVMGQPQPGMLGTLLGKEAEPMATEETGDCNGHGTRMASLIGGKTYGLANRATLRPLRVLGCNGEGSMSGVLLAIEWLAAHFQRPSVLYMPFASGQSMTLDKAIRQLSDRDILIVAAAGNTDPEAGNERSADACNFSPGRVGPVITVAGTNENDKMSGFSKGGACVDFLAPAENVPVVASKKSVVAVSGTDVAAAVAAAMVANIREEYSSLAGSKLLRAIEKKCSSNAATAVGAGTTTRMLSVASTVKPVGNVSDEEPSLNL